MKFVIVSDRAPRTCSVCTHCAKPIEVGYLRELKSNRPYCDHACYRGRKIVLAPWSFAQLDEFASISLQFAGDFHRALLDMYGN